MLNLFDILNINEYDININNLIYTYVKHLEDGDIYNKCILLCVKQNGPKIINKISLSTNIDECIIDWRYISRNEDLSEEFIEKFADKICWNLLGGENQKFSETFIEKHIDKLNLENILHYQELSETFIEKHVDKYTRINWNDIFERQNISEAFVNKYKSHVSWYYIVDNKYLSKEFIIDILSDNTIDLN